MPATSFLELEKNSACLSKPAIKSALLILNQPSGRGRTSAELALIIETFQDTFAFLPKTCVAITQNHQEVIKQTEAFLQTHSGPCLLIVGGGGGTNRALVQGLFQEISPRGGSLEDVYIAALRLGSGNLLPKYLGVSKNVKDAMRELAAALLQDRTTPCYVYSCTVFSSQGQTHTHYGLTMGGLGQFAQVPDDAHDWRDKHPHLMRWLNRFLSMEKINTMQYLSFSLWRAIQCFLRPNKADLVKIKHGGQTQTLRLFSGLLINFDFPELPFQTGCEPNQARFVLCIIPLRGRKQTLACLWHWRNLNQYVIPYEITTTHPLEIEFLDKDKTVVALDEDTFSLPHHLRFEVVAPIKVLIPQQL